MPTPPRVYLFLSVGLVAASQSGNLVRLGQAPAVTMAAWRLILASSLLGLLARGKLRQLASLRWADRLYLLLAGLALSAHLITWIAAVQSTTVASAAIFFSVNPVFTALAAHLFFGERLGARLFVSIALGLAGSAVIGWSDFSLRPEHLAGDLLALLCSAFFTLYFLLGKRLRRTLDTDVYAAGIYGVAGSAGFAAAALLGLPLIGFDGRTWLAFGLLALVPTLIGHTSFNFALRYLDAGRIATATLVEPLLAGLVAFWAYGEPLTASMAAGYALIAASVVVLALDRPGRGAPAA
ncbi:MAG: DMT family transporter [Myxococcales bacterium]|nr:DMT family transporter [Myxococcales bacterium]